MRRVVVVPTISVLFPIRFSVQTSRPASRARAVIRIRIKTPHVRDAFVPLVHLHGRHVVSPVRSSSASFFPHGFRMLNETGTRNGRWTGMKWTGIYFSSAKNVRFATTCVQSARTRVVARCGNLRNSARSFPRRIRRIYSLVDPPNNRRLTFSRINTNHTYALVAV